MMSHKFDILVQIQCVPINILEQIQCIPINNGVNPISAGVDHILNFEIVKHFVVKPLFI